MAKGTAVGVGAIVISADRNKRVKRKATREKKHLEKVTMIQVETKPRTMRTASTRTDKI
ncbi:MULTISPECIES: hypothetical protein [Burkholderia]|uniref:hypothetical protein n=1 Tax=Burkholderia TaxID=32008 RepID=UPI0013F143DB|nr:MULTISPECIES: hypothetical protein [Burkholderia]MBR8093122.1 hypothetical protein [Burkholderia cenocepacia]MBS6359086.1 hypothetical protein [Burkholderia sp.]MBY4714279.1 hypothetical protein [Burkholderia cepacia]MBY4740082.1 hypothetical protein [Burkholderia cepacia]MBY4743406.1 hypothetical protein [Burkholderia cepacia]